MGKASTHMLALVVVEYFPLLLSSLWPQTAPPLEMSLDFDRSSPLSSLTTNEMVVEQAHLVDSVQRICTTASSANINSPRTPCQSRSPVQVMNSDQGSTHVSGCFIASGDMQRLFVDHGGRFRCYAIDMSLRKVIDQSPPSVSEIHASKV